MALLELILPYALAVAIVILTIGTVFVKWSYSFWRRRGVFYIEPSFPFGNLREAFMGRKHVGYVMQDLHNKLEDRPYGGIFYALQPVLLVREPNIIRDVMVKYFGTNFHHRIAGAHEQLDPMMFRNLFMARGSKWRSLRNHLSPTFTSGKMKMMFHLVQEKAEMLVEQMDKNISDKGEGTTMDLKEYLALYTTDVISSCAFGIDTNSLQNPNNQFREMGRSMFRQTLSHLLNTLVIFAFPKYVKVTRSVFISKEVADFFRKVVWDVVHEREEKNIFRGDFLDLLIQLKNTGKIQDTDTSEEATVNSQVGYKKNLGSELKNFDGDDFVAQVVLFFGAGFETSSTTGSFALFELAANPEAQEKLIEEVDATLAATGGKITYEAIQSMRYVDMVINETLRKYPPVASLDRQCTKEYRNEEYGLVVPEGVPVAVSLFGLHRDPAVFPDPEKFEPERFSEENVKKIPNYYYMPFGEGPRNCIGMRFGVLQSKVSLVNVMSRMRVALTDEWKGMKSLPINPKSFVLGVESGIPLVVTRRTPNEPTNS